MLETIAVSNAGSVQAARTCFGGIYSFHGCSLAFCFDCNCYTDASINTFGLDII